MTQQALAASMAITFQQVQKYEHGANRLGASRLWDLGRALNVSISYFFEGMSEDVAKASPRNLTPETTEVKSAPERSLITRETLEFIRAYQAISNPFIRQRIYDVTKLLSATDEDSNFGERTAALTNSIRHVANAFGDSDCLYEVNSLQNSSLLSLTHAIEVWANEGGASSGSAEISR